MFGEWILGLWSLTGLLWWVMAWRLVQTESKQPNLNSLETWDFISIFKPLPPLRGAGLSGFRAGLESFVSQLDAQSEMLLGIHEEDRAMLEPFLQTMQDRFPQARIKPVYRRETDETPNPKVAWQKFLAPQARGPLWLWSDSDIVAPSDFISSIRKEFPGAGAKMLTFPYVVREVAGAPAFLDALFVNVEFHPGVLLLRGRGMVDFGLGAGMLFRQADFEAAVNWEELGSALADDFVLGQRLSPVRVSQTRVLTTAEADSWGGAVLHYLRWSKTVCWNRPWGAASRLVTLPVFGWLLYLLLHPHQAGAWLGFIAMIQLDVFFAALICRKLGCDWKVRDLLTMEAWSLGRVLVWLACWVPWPVIWRDRWWWGPKAKERRKVWDAEDIDKD